MFYSFSGSLLVGILVAVHKWMMIVDLSLRKAAGNMALWLGRTGWLGRTLGRTGWLGSSAG